MKHTEPDWKISRSRRLKKREESEQFKQEVASSEIDLFHPEFMRSTLEGDSLEQFDRLEMQEQRDVSDFLDVYASYRSGSLTASDQQLLPLNQSSLDAVAKHMLGNNGEVSFEEQKFFLSFLLDRSSSASVSELDIGLSAVLSYLKSAPEVTEGASAEEQEKLSSLCVQYINNCLLRMELWREEDLEEIDFLEELAQELIDLPNKNPHLYAVIAMTNTTTARAYFESTDTGLTPDEIQDMSVLPDDYFRTELSDEFEDLFYDDYDDDDYYEQDYPDDDYHNTEGLVFEGEGLYVREGYEEGQFRIDFTPRGRTSYSPEIRTEVLLAGYHDFKKLFEKSDLQLSETDVFEGYTNREMAKAALLMGFTLTDEDDEYGQYVVQARYQDIVQALKRLENKTHNGESLLQKMQTRVDRQRAKEEVHDDSEVGWDEVYPSYG